MIWLVLSIICSTLIFVIFKYFDQFKIDNLQAIIVNYIVASSLGMALRGFDTSIIEIPEKNWFWSAFILGIIFIWLFRLMALASQKIGVSVVSITVKMSLVIPVLFGVFYYHESIGLVKVLGISIALLAVYLTTAKDKAKKSSGLYIKLPLILFFGSGIMDTFINFNQEEIVFPINNVGIVALSVLFAVLLFSEKLNVKNKIGIALALISIALLGFDSFD